MTLVVVLLGLVAGLAWFLPDDKKQHDRDVESYPPDEL